MSIPKGETKAESAQPKITNQNMYNDEGNCRNAEEEIDRQIFVFCDILECPGRGTLRCFFSTILAGGGDISDPYMLKVRCAFSAASPSSGSASTVFFLLEAAIPIGADLGP